MGGSASEVLSSPEVMGAAGGAAAGAPFGPVGMAVGAGIGVLGAVAGKKAAKEQDQRYKDALEQAKNLTTTSSTDVNASSSSAESSSRDSQTTFSKAGKTEKELQNASISNFKQQQALVGDAQAQIQKNQKLENQSQGTLGNVLGGQAFAVSSDEQARINAMREANIAAGANPVNKMLDERLANIQADAARRGIRGQAVSQLQTGALAAGAESMDRNTLEANRIAAEQAIALPGQRVGIQASTATNFADFADQARQQAIQNRADLQDPVALQQLRDERLRQGVTHEISAGESKQASSSSTKGSATGEGAAGILAAQAGSPGAAASGMAGALGTIGAAGQAAGGIAQAKNAFATPAAAPGAAGTAPGGVNPAPGTGLGLTGGAPAGSAGNQRLAQAGLTGAPAGNVTRPQTIASNQPIKKVTR